MIIRLIQFLILFFKIEIKDVFPSFGEEKPIDVVKVKAELLKVQYRHVFPNNWSDITPEQKVRKLKDTLVHDFKKMLEKDINEDTVDFFQVVHQSGFPMTKDDLKQFQFEYYWVDNKNLTIS